MEKIKHLISSSLLAAMLFTMCGCDDDKNKTSKGTENSSVSNYAETTSQAVSDTQSDEKKGNNKSTEATEKQSKTENSNEIVESQIDESSNETVEHDTEIQSDKQESSVSNETSTDFSTESNNSEVIELPIVPFE